MTSSRAQVRAADAVARAASGSALAAELDVRAPGESEHHSGRAVDLVDGSWDPAVGMTEELAYTPGYLWLLENAGAFGFEQGAEEVNRHFWHWRFRAAPPTQ